MSTALDLRAARLQRGLTQEDLAADLVGIRPATLHAIEHGSSVPRRSTRKSIEQILGCEIDWLGTLAQDKKNVGAALTELINFDEPNAEDRIKFCRQYLSALQILIEEI